MIFATPSKIGFASKVITGEMEQKICMTGESSTAERLDFIRELLALLRFHQQIGLEFYPFALPEALKGKAGRIGLPRAADSDVPAFRIRESSLAGHEGRTSEPVDLGQAVAGCRNCSRGGEGAVALQGEGKAGADLFIVVEKSIITASKIGQLLSEEDRALLGKMLTAIKVSPDAVYLAPLVKCGSTAEQQTTREEQVACLPFLEKQIASLRPRAILVFGEEASQALLKSEQPLFHLRGKVETVQDIPVLATYHPAQLRQEPALKQMAWQDLQLLQKVLAGKKV